jgi:hypothetical protein
MRHLEYDQVQFFEHVDGYVHALDEGLRQAGCFLSSGGCTFLFTIYLLYVIRYMLYVICQMSNFLFQLSEILDVVNRFYRESRLAQY